MSTITTGIDAVTAGSTAQAYAQWELPVKSADLPSASVTWTLIDGDGRVFNSGSGGPVVANASSVKPGMYIIRSDATILVPGTIPVNNNGTRYQISWRLVCGSQDYYSFDNFTVHTQEYNREGPTDIVELFGTTSSVYLKTSNTVSNLNIALYRGNSSVYTAPIDTSPTTDQDGYVYEAVINTASLSVSASLDPLSVVWSYDTNQIESSAMYLINPSILQAARDLESFLNKALIDTGIDPSTTFSTVDMIRHLRVGADIFNSVARPTTFTMTNAASGVRQYWLMYAAIDACRSQYLAEGMKAFNFSGQTVSLDIDRSPFWDSMSQQLQSQADQYVKPFKDNLAKYGINGGDGSASGPRPGNVGTIGISLSPITPLRFGYQRFFGGGNGQY